MNNDMNGIDVCDRNFLTKKKRKKKIGMETSEDQGAEIVKRREKIFAEERDRIWLFSFQTAKPNWRELGVKERRTRKFSGKMKEKKKNPKTSWFSVGLSLSLSLDVKKLENVNVGEGGTGN